MGTDCPTALQKYKIASVLIKAGQFVTNLCHKRYVILCLTNTAKLFSNC